jgi:hypothetical protein
MQKDAPANTSGLRPIAVATAAMAFSKGYLD